MGYIPTEWQTGDVITAEKLNKAEEGIAAAGAYMVPAVLDTETSEVILQASFDDITDAVSAGRLVMTKYDTSENEYDISFLYRVSVIDDDFPYQVFFFDPDGVQSYHAVNSSDNLVLFEPA